MKPLNSLSELNEYVGNWDIGRNPQTGKVTFVMSLLMMVQRKKPRPKLHG